MRSKGSKYALLLRVIFCERKFNTFERGESKINKRRILIIGPYIPGKRYGGPVKSITNLVNALCDEFNFDILSTDRDHGANTPYNEVVIGAWNTVGSANVYYVPLGSELKSILAILKSGHFDLIYSSSFFSKNSIIIQVLKYLRLIKIPVIVAPCGEFSKGALQIKSVKKKLYFGLYKALSFNKTLIYSCSSEIDKQDTLAVLGAGTDIKIAGNIVGLSDVDLSIKQKHPGFLKISTLSRVSNIKNLDFSLQVLKELSKKKNINQNVIFDIYGPIEDVEYWNRCKQMILDINNVEINYIGALDYDEVVVTLSNYHVFLMPTKGENFGHVIQEALLAGCPLIISDQTPWRELESKGIGFDLPLTDKNAYLNALEYYLQMNESEYKLASNRAYTYGIERVKNQNAIEEYRTLFYSALSLKNVRRH